MIKIKETVEILNMAKWDLCFTVCDSIGWIPETLVEMYHHMYVCVCLNVCVFSHGATFVLVRVRVFEPESVLRSIFLQVGQLFTIDGSTPLPETQIFYSENQCGYPLNTLSDSLYSY